MRKHTLVVGVAAFLLFSGCLGATESINESYTSEYTYTVSVRTNAALENASFLLPAPIYRNESEVARKLVDEHRTGARNLTEERRHDRPDWNLSLVETRYGRMLRIHADRIEPRFAIPQPIDQEGNPLPTNESPRPQTRSVSASLQIDRSIDTMNALQNEPVLHPKLDVHRVECSPLPPEDSVVECYRYEGRIFASYRVTDTSNTSNPEVDVAASLDGGNSWFTLGWTGNNYHDFTNAVIQGDHEGWVETHGRFRQGDGNYLDSPPR